MSTSNLRILASKVPKVSLKGLAYLASANFLARAIIFVRHYIVTAFHSEMILIYGATLDTRILLFFQAIYMLPMFLLGIFVFYGIERESFNLVLYPTLMLVFLILLRYGSEAALLAVHWEDHKLEQTPDLVFALVQDIIFIGLLLLYVYFSLAFTSIKPTPLELVEGGNVAMISAAQRTNLVPVVAAANPSSDQLSPVTLLQPPQAHYSADPDSQGLNYPTRKNVDQVPKETLAESKPILGETEKEKLLNTLIVLNQESGSGVGGGLKETDLDAAVPVPSTSMAAIVEVPEVPEEPAKEESPVVTVKLNKSKIAAARKKLAETQKEPEKPAEPELDFWGSSNGDSAPEASKSESFKTTSV